jgi:SAM-dependent methyltransferase
MDDLPRHFTIRESSHRIHNPLTPEKLAALGDALLLPPGTTVLDLACGTGEMLCTWARDLGFTGTGVDVSSVFIKSARARAQELGVAGKLEFVHADASGYVAREPVGVAACLGVFLGGNGAAGTVELLRRSLAPGGIMLIGEPYWRKPPPDQETVEGSSGIAQDEWAVGLDRLLGSFADLGLDVVEMVLANGDDWDRYEAAKWLSIRRWLDANPDDELYPEMRAELTAAPVRHARYRREYLGWGLFALMDR